MPSQCEHCKEFAVDDSEGYEVCKSCGIVVEGINFSTAESAVKRPTFTPFSKSESRLNKQKSKPAPLAHGLTVLEQLCRVNNISSEVRGQIKELFTLIVTVKKFSRKEDGGAAVACCLYLLQQKNNQTIPINSLCKQVPCTKKKFSTFLTFLKSCLSSNEKFKNYSYILDSNVSDSRTEDEEDILPGTVQPLIYEVLEKAETGEKAELMDKTSSLVKLAYSCWLLTGRSPKSIVVASAFLCWKSMMLHRNKKTSFPEFCTKFEVNDPKASVRVTELKTLLLKLGKMIPSHIENYVNEKNLLYHLNTILEHSEILRYELVPDSYTCEEVDTAEFSNFREPSIKRNPRKEASDAVHYDSDMNASDIELSDSEINSYLNSNKKRVVEYLDKQETATSSCKSPPS